MKITVKKLEEFLDEELFKFEKNKKKNQKNDKIIKDLIKDNDSESEPNIEISIIKTKDTKTLKISIEAFNDGEIINFDIEIDKDTFFELVDEMK
jgi:hypothetical protein